MKSFVFAAMLLTVASAALAQERVIADRENLDINSHEAILVRTKDTPNKLDIDMLVPMSEPVCERRETRMVMQTSAFHCGTVRERRLQVERVCVSRHENGRCATYERRENVVHIERPRTCLVPESYCVQYGSVTDYEKDNVKIKFKNAASLADGEEETFLIRARQKNHGGENVVYEIEPVTTKGKYTVKSRGWFGTDHYEIKGE